MTGLESGSPAAPAWYADPSVRAQWRYWDGSSWTAWVNRGEVAVPHPLGAPEADPPGLGTRATGLTLRDIEPRPPSAAAYRASPGSPGPNPRAGHRYAAALCLAAAGAAAVLIGVLLFTTSRPSTAAWDIPPGEGYGTLAVVAGDRKSVV